MKEIPTMIREIRDPRCWNCKLLLKREYTTITASKVCKKDGVRLLYTKCGGCGKTTKIYEAHMGEAWINLDE